MEDDINLSDKDKFSDDDYVFFNRIFSPSPTPIPNTDFERMEGWLTSNGAIHGTVLEYSCSIGYRDSRTPCLPTRRTCHAGQWVGNMPSCGKYRTCCRI